MFYRYSKLQSHNMAINFNFERAVDSFLDNLLESNNIAEALSRLLREGVGDSEYRIKGIEDIMEELRQLKDGYFHRYDVSRLREDLLRELEKIAESHLGLSQLKKLKKDFLKNTRHDDYIKNLSGQLKYPPPYTKENISDFIELMNRYNFRFTGSEPLTFNEALEIFRKLQRIEELERYLRNEDVNAIDSSEVFDLLGRDSIESLNTMRHIIQQIESRGYIKTTDGRMDLTPKGIRRIGEKALMDILQRLDKVSFGFHELKISGNGDMLTGGTRKFRFGDTFDVDIVNTIKNSLRRYSLKDKKFNIEPDDFEIYEKESSTRLSTVLLLDMSWSMSWGNKFTAAKKVGIAMEELIRTRFPQDKLFIVGFFTVAVELKPYQLPTLDLNLNDPFTNIQDALLLADRLLARENNTNKFVILITDGQPTAYFESGILEVEWPVFGISPKSFEKTLEAVHLLTKHNIKINTFMLDSNPVLVQFVEDMMKINHGRAFFTTPESLGTYLLVDYLERKRKLIN